VITILFVDDESDILEGIRLRLRKKRHSRRLLFATSADEAESLMSSHHVDLLVTDIRMPHRDGIDLLETAARKYPSVTRAVLSGSVDDDAIANAMPIVTRVLRKPCDAEDLEKLVQRIEKRAMREQLGV
jgi:YesN/AraC family two-component response regulator